MSENKTTSTEYRVGEFHNFGKAVKRVSENLIYKPRSIFWEWLFIGSSPLRKFLDSILFESIPITASWPLTTFLTNDNFSSGHVAFISATQWRTISLQEARQIGFTFGLVLWFGLGDLHYQNIVVGRQDGGKFVFAPLDIESIFENIFLPSQTLLLPNIELPLHHSGIGAVSQNLMEPNLILEICRGLYFSYTELMRNSEKIKKLITTLILNNRQPIRKIVRSTHEYVDLLEKKILAKDLSEPLHESEKIQLARGDVPYYFRFSDASKLYYYSSPHEFTEVVDFGYSANDKGIPSIVVNNRDPFWTRDDNRVLKLSLLQIARKLIPKGKSIDSFCGRDRLYTLNNKIYLKIEDMTVSTNAI